MGLHVQGGPENINIHDFFIPQIIPIPHIIPIPQIIPIPHIIPLNIK